jgi:N-acetylglucosamine kinase-like BadF-type ATPase
MPDEIYPPIFPVIAAAADSGDVTAQGILAHAARQLSLLVAEVAQRLRLAGSEFLLAKIGGTSGRSRFFDAQVDAELKNTTPAARIEPLRMSPAEAAAVAAKAAYGG